VHLTLPAPLYAVPREKPLPPATKPKTKWQAFAEKKGIKAKRRDERENKVYDEEAGEWKKKWGYKGANKDGENQWLVELKGDGKEKVDGKDGSRGEMRKDRMDRIKRNERKERANEKKTRKVGKA
jgi:regulator of ribosome biosynthesis